MADNVTIPATGSAGSSNPVVATDEVGGRHFQILKLAIGPDGSASLVTETAPLPVTAKQPLEGDGLSTFATVGVVSGQALAADTDRKGLTMVNTSSNWIYLAFGGTPAVVGSGVALAPNGGVWSMSEHDFTHEAVNAIATGGASNLSIQSWH